MPMGEVGNSREGKRQKKNKVKARPSGTRSILARKMYAHARARDPCDNNFLSKADFIMKQTNFDIIYFHWQGFSFELLSPYMVCFN